jgi:multisubunit Na+/H+ antiporter MnhE subunit
MHPPLVQPWALALVKLSQSWGFVKREEFDLMAASAGRMWNSLFACVSLVYILFIEIINSIIQVMRTILYIFPE